MSTKVYLAIDIGGQSCKYGIFSSELTQQNTPKLIYKDYIKYNDTHELINGTNIKKIILNLVESVCTKYSIAEIGISSPGIINPNNSEISGLSAIIDYNTVNWDNILKNYASKIHVNNDGNCAVMAEKKFGNGTMLRNFAVIVIGTGIGGGILIDNKLYYGHQYAAGEFGLYQIYNYKTKKYSNLSENCSMYALEKKYFNITNKNLNAKTIFNSLYTDKTSKLLINELINNLALAIVNINLVFNLDATIIGGAVSKNETFMNLLKSRINKILTDDMFIKINLMSCKFNNDSNLYGALSTTNIIIK